MDHYYSTHGKWQSEWRQSSHKKTHSPHYLFILV